MSQDIQSCAELVQRGDPDRFLSAMSGSIQSREALFVLYAFNLEVARAPWVTKEAMIAEMRLQWWLDVIEEIFEGKEVRHHEVVTPLSRLIKNKNLPKELFEKIINARRWDIYKEPHADAAELDKYVANTAGALMRLSILALDGKDNEAVSEYGYGTGVASLLAAIPALENAQKYPLIDGTSEGVKALAKVALSRLQAAKSDLSNQPKNIRSGLRAGFVAESILKAAIAEPMSVSEGAVTPPEGRKKLRMIWLSVTNRF